MAGVILLDELDLDGGQLIMAALLSTIVVPIFLFAFYKVHQRTPFRAKETLIVCNILNVVIFCIWFNAGLKNYGEFLIYQLSFAIIASIGSFNSVAMYSMSLPKNWINTLNSVSTVMNLGFIWLGKVVVEMFRSGGATNRGSVMSLLFFIVPAIVLLWWFDVDRANAQRKSVEAWDKKLEANTPFGKTPQQNKTYQMERDEELSRYDDEADFDLPDDMFLPQMDPFAQSLEKKEAALDAL